MTRSSNNSSSTHASHNNRFRRGHNSENRRRPYRTEHSHSHVQRGIHRSGYPPCISFNFTGTTHIHLPPTNGSFVMPTHAPGPQDLRTSVGAGRGSSRAGYHQQIGLAPFLDVPEQEHLRDWHYPQPSGGLYNGGLTGDARTDAVRPGSVTGGPGANLTPGVPTRAVGLGPRDLRTGVGGTGVRISEYSSPGNSPQPPLSFRYVPFTCVNEFTGLQTPAAGRGSSRAGYHQKIGPAPFLDVPEPEHLRDWRYPQPSGGLYNGGLTGDARTDAVRPGSVTGGPGANLTPGVPTPAVGHGPAGSSRVGYNQLSPIAALGFAGQTSQAPFLSEYDSRGTSYS